MITLQNKTTNKTIGVITEEQLQVLINSLEEEHDADQDYWINRDTVLNLKEAGADATLVAMLEIAMGDLEEIDIAWTRA
jgi:hypothetical protein